MTGKVQREQESTGAGSSDAGFPNKRMVGGHKAEAARGNLVDLRRHGTRERVRRTVWDLSE